MASRTEVVTAARQWIDTRWSHQHRFKGVGTDCAGLVLGVAAELNLANPDVPAYSRQPANGSLTKYCLEHMRIVGDLALGRVALLRFSDEPQHLGIVGDYPLGGFSLIHAYATSRKVVEHRIDELWRNRIIALFELPGVTE
ncbi:MAG: peptidase P60 [Blastocatellia bacterium]|nr:peptidase P60 [Blastocatellia bacterium]